LLIGGDKSTQQRDIERATEILKRLRNRGIETSRFDIADYLDSNEMIAEYLNTVLAEGNDSDVITTIGHIAKAIGMTKIAQETGMSRTSLYKALSDGAKPQFETIMKVLRAIGGKIQINLMTA
jgi:probable addiction module antidote protein